MKVVVFNGSPRVGGNIDLMLKEAERAVKAGGHELVRFNLNLMNIRPCQDCGGCEATGRCVVKDDMTSVAEGIREADRIILASPIFFFGLSAQTKAMVDRCQAFWCEKYLLKQPIAGGPYGRKGLLLLVGGMKKEIGMQCSGSTATAFFRTVSVPVHDVVSFLGIDKKGAILAHETALAEVHAAAQKLVSLTT